MQPIVNDLNQPTKKDIKKSVKKVSEADRFARSIFNSMNIEGLVGGINEYDIEDIISDLPEPVIEKGSKMSEVAIYNAFRKNKKFNAMLDKSIKEMVFIIRKQVNRDMNQILSDRKSNEAENKRIAKKNKQNKKSSNKIRKAAVKAEAKTSFERLYNEYGY